MEVLYPKVDKVKLIIWDLDETFWQGTLSEEGVTPITTNIELVKALSERGIINSIVSKNDFAMAKAKLEELGIWEYFVFPAIEWKPKGVLIQEIIKNCQLRAPNVVFLDDNHSNLEEARFYNPEIHAFFPDFIPHITEHQAFKGKEDAALTRLKQYKILEEKHDVEKTYSSNEDFLRASNIQVQVIEDCSEYIDRISELIERTNQLNFTKKRIDRDAVKLLLEDRSKQSAVIHVKDNFGDYGVVGFYTYNSDHTLEHFVFSCRVLNLGIPCYIYHKLNSPQLTIIPEVAETLEGQAPTWITESQQLDIAPKKIAKASALKLLFRGPCDFKQSLFYLEQNGISIDEEVNYVTDHLPLIPLSTYTLVQALQLSTDQKAQILAHTPFIDHHYHETSILDDLPDALVLAVETDLYQPQYENKKYGFRICLGNSLKDLTDPANHPYFLDYFLTRGASKYSEEDLIKFSKDFKHLGPISPEDFSENLREIRKSIPGHIPILFVNIPTQGQEALHTKNLAFNSQLDQFISEQANCFLADVRKLEGASYDHHSITKSYSRKNYLDLSSLLFDLLKTSTKKEINSKISPITIAKNKVRVAYLKSKNFVRKSIWMKLKNIKFILLTELFSEELLAEFLLMV